MDNQFESRGKLLLSGEYVVLDGALALAVPTQLGQSLCVKSTSDSTICWKSVDHHNSQWFTACFKLQETKYQPLEIIETSDLDLANRLANMFDALSNLKPNLFSEATGFDFESKLDFPRDWGLGSSSTLINNIANWADVDAYKLLEQTFGGSGYDIACASASSSLIYQLNKNDSINGLKRTVETVDFKPIFSEYLFFIHLNKKQNSRDGIARYRSNANQTFEAVKRISDITRNLLECSVLEEFQNLLKLHERIISKLIDLEPIQNRLFADFNGQIKSLGAWGGDFIMACSRHDVRTYFESKGYRTILNYEEMVLNKKDTTK